MSTRSRIKKKQRRDFDSRLRYNNGADRVIDEWKLIDIHRIPAEFEYENEFDFWCHNGHDLYLLRLRKTETEQYYIAKSKGIDAAIYLIAEFDFQHLNNDLIKSRIEFFKKKGIPNWTVDKLNIKLKTSG